MQKLLSILLLTVVSLKGMQKEEVVGTVLITGSYFALIEYTAALRQHDAKTTRFIMAGGTMHCLGLGILAPQLLKSKTPVFTAFKYETGALFLANAVYMCKCAKELERDGDPENGNSINKLLSGANLCTAFGIAMIGWAKNDSK